MSTVSRVINDKVRTKRRESRVRERARAERRTASQHVTLPYAHEVTLARYEIARLSVIYTVPKPDFSQMFHSADVNIGHTRGFVPLSALSRQKSVLPWNVCQANHVHFLCKPSGFTFIDFWQ